MRFLPSQVTKAMKIACLFTKDSLPTISRLVKCITRNPFTQDQLTKLNKKIIVPETMRTVIYDLEAIGEKQFQTFVTDQLVVSKVPISQKITLNKINISDHNDARQLKCKVESGYKRRKTIVEELLEHEINNIPQNLCKEGKRESNYTMVQKFKLLNRLIDQLL